jgi:hypothetical protein
MFLNPYIGAGFQFCFGYVGCYVFQNKISSALICTVRSIFAGDRDGGPLRTKAQGLGGLMTTDGKV